MLKEYDIKNVISIDDGWETAEELEEKIEKSGLDANMTAMDYCEAYGIEIDASEETDFKEYGFTPIKELETIKDIMPQTYNTICETLQGDIEAALKTLRSILDQLKEKFTIYTGSGFRGFYRELEGNTLYILDKDMGKNRENEFLDYIVSVIDERKSHNDLVIVYSNEVKGLLEHDQKVKYIESHNSGRNDLEVLYQFWPLSKITDEILLVTKIKEMLSKSMYGKALSKMIDMKKSSVDKAFKDLLHINIDNLDDMIIESYIEGGKITESYELLIDSLIRRSLLQQLETSGVLDYEKGLLQYEEKRAKEILTEQQVDNTKKYGKFQKISRKKKVVNSVLKAAMLFNIADYSVNQEYDNPAMGDIYVLTDARTNKRCAGMLISQECTTMIRKGNFEAKPRRSADELLLLLFDIVEISEDAIVDRIVEKLDNCIWPVKIENKICLLENTKTSMYVKPEMLDLCGLNPDGKANIKFDKNALEYKGVYAKEFYKDFEQVIEQRICNVVTQVMHENGIKRKDSNIRNMIVSLAYGVVYKDNFELQRICRIEEKHSLHIIHEYLNGIGKIGLPVVPNL